MISLAGKVGKKLSYQIIPEKIACCYRYCVSEGELPQGLSLSDDGLVYGKLKNVGNHSFFITAKSKCYKETFCFSLRVKKRIIRKKVKWVAIGGNTAPSTGSIYYSYDTVNWDLALARDRTMYGVAYNGSRWITVGVKSIDDFGIFYSNDGISWTPSNDGFSSVGRGIAWGLDKWVTVGGDGIKYSSDGINWNDATGSLFGFDGNGVAWNGLKWVAVGSPGSQSIKTSLDGIYWLDATGSLFINGGAGVAASGTSMWVAVGSSSSSGNILHSTNGENWTVANNGFSLRGKGVATNKEKWVSVGSNSDSINILNSDNGEDWKAANNGFSNLGNGVATDGTTWLAVGNDTSSRIKYSANGFDWINTIGGFPSGENGNGVASATRIIS